MQSDTIGELLQDILKQRNEIMAQFDNDSWADFQQGKYSENKTIKIKDYLRLILRNKFRIL